MTFEFEYLDERDEWHVLGTGNGAGDDPIAEALTDCSDGVSLSVGKWRARPAGTNEGWQLFWLDPGGKITLHEV